MKRRTALLLLGLSWSAAARAADSAPSPSASSGNPSAEAVIAEVPFLTSDEPNRILVDLAPDGYPPFRMMIDTGAADSVLTPRYAQKLGVIVRRTKDTPYRHATRLGRDLQFWVDVSSSDTASKTGWEYGLLGGTFLREYVVELDFAGRQVRFLDPERYKVPEKVEAENEAVIPIKVVGNRLILPVSIGTGVVQVMLDTGAWDSVILSGDAARKVEISSTPLPGLGAGSVWGPVEVEFAEADRLRVGPFELTHVPLLVAPKGWYNMGPATDSLIGYDILSQFVVRIDYPRQRLWLQRRPNAEVTYAGISYTLERRAGLLAYPRAKGLEVAVVFPDSPAAQLGIRPGDVLAPLNGEKATDFDSKALETIAAGGEVTVSRQMNGVWVDVPLPSGLGEAPSEGSKN
jgi:predicted aspartyl protease